MANKKKSRRRGQKHRPLRSALEQAQQRERAAQHYADLTAREQSNMESMLDDVEVAEDGTIPVPRLQFRSDKALRGDSGLRQRVAALGSTLHIQDGEDADGHVQAEIIGDVAAEFARRMIADGLLAESDLTNNPYLRWADVRLAPSTVKLAEGGVRVPLVGQKVTESDDGVVTVSSDKPFDVAPGYDFSSREGRDTIAWMPTATLVAFSKVARERGLPNAMTEEELKALDPRGRHVVYRADLVAYEGRHSISAEMMLCVPGHDAEGMPNRFDRTIDLPVREWGLLMDGLHLELPSARALIDDFDATNGQSVLRGAGGVDGLRPRWIGSRSFDRVWDACGRWGGGTLIFEYVRREDWPGDNPRQKEWWEEIKELSFDGKALLAMDAIERLRHAQVLATSIDVFEGAPEWDDMAAMWQWAMQADLPFDPLYLDFTGPGGICPLLNLRLTSGADAPVELRAAIVHKDGDRLVVEPFGGPVDSVDPWMPHGRLVVGGDPPPDPITWASVQSPTVAVTNVIALCDPAQFGGGPGRLEVAPDQHFVGEHALRDGDPDGAVLSYGAMLLALAGRALSVLSMLEAINVDVVQDPPAREDQRALKRARKRGWDVKIAETVVVRPSGNRTAQRGQGGGETRDYTHAFTRRGHYAYYPLGTRMADRLVEANPSDKRLVDHPDKGLCRKVFRPQTVVGANGPNGSRPLVHKTRVWRTPPRGSLVAPTKE